MIETLNEFGQIWVNWVLSGLIGTFLVAVIATLVWLSLRNRASASLGCWLFLLVAVKLFVPLEVPLPNGIASLMPKWPLEKHAIIQQPAPEPVVYETPAMSEVVIESSGDRFMTGEVPSVPVPKYMIEFSTIRPTAWLAVIWLLTVCVLFVRFLWNEVLFRRTISLSSETDLSIRELAEAMGIRQRISVRESDRIAIPAVSGFFRPVILLPKQFVDTLPSDEMRWILLHELAHIKRFDLPTALVLRVATILQFFNPSLWYASMQIRKLREYACDDLALATLNCENVQKTGGSALLHVVEHARSLQIPANQALGAFNVKTSLKTRLRRLLDTRRTIRTRLGLGSVLVLLIVAAVALPKLTAQQESLKTEAVVPPKSLALDNDKSGVDVQEKPTASLKATENGPKQKTTTDKIASILAPEDITIQVVDERDKPIQGAKIGFRHAEDGYGRKQVITDENGKAVYKDMTGKSNILSAGLEVYADGYANYYRYWERQDGRFDTVPAELRIVMQKGVRIGGKVVDEQGKPIEGARVDVCYPSPIRSNFNERAGRPTTDAEGCWALNTFPPDIDEFRLNIDHPKFQSTDNSTKYPTLNELKSQQAVIVLKAGEVVTGIVKKEDGAPIEGATVVFSRTPFTGEFRVVKTDKTGKYSVNNWRKTGTFIAAIAVDSAPDSKSLNEKELDSPIDFTLKSGKTIRLKFVDQQGQPVEGVRVSPFRWRGQTAVLSGSWQSVPGNSDAEGNYRWTWAPDDVIEYSFQKNGYLAVRDMALKPSDEVRTITMLRPLTINGTVIDAETKKPIPEFNVIPGINWGQPNISGGEVGWETEKTQPFRGGQFKTVFDDPRHGHHVRVEATGYLPFSSEMYKDDQGEVNLTVELQKGKDMQGRVLLPDGKPAEKFEVMLVTKGGNSPNFRNGILDEEARKRYKFLPADSDGRFVVPQLAEPFILVPFAEAGIAKISGKAFLENPEARTVTLLPWGRVEGQLMIPPILGAGLRTEIGSGVVSMTQGMFSWDAGPRDEPSLWFSYTTQPDESGRFVFDRVLPSRVDFVYQSYRSVDDGTLLQTPFVHTSVEIEPGKTARIQLGRPGPAVEGEIVLSETDRKTVDWKNATIRVWPNIGPTVPPPAPKFSDGEREKFFNKIEQSGQTYWTLKKMNDEERKAWQEVNKAWAESEEGKEKFQTYKEYQEKLKATAGRDCQAIPDENGMFRFGAVAPGEYWYSVRFDSPGKTRQESFNRKVLASSAAEITVPEKTGTVKLGDLSVELRELNRNEQFRWSSKR